MTMPYAEVIGDPVAHSRSPAIHRFWLEEMGISGDYRASRVVPEDLPDILARRWADPHWRGCNVTMPLKEKVLPLLRAVDPHARAAGAVNTVGADRTGYNSDLLAVRDCLERAEVTGGALHIIGTGGAARAAALGARAAGYTDIVLHGRSVDKARNVASVLLGDADKGRPLDRFAAEGADVLINASPLGMSGFPLPDLDLSLLSKNALVFDMVYDPVETWLMKEARRHDVKVVDGLDMLIAQAAFAFALFFGAPAPRHFDARLRERIAG
jgi:shikimate dehydrogenase